MQTVLHIYTIYNIRATHNGCVFRVALIRKLYAKLVVREVHIDMNEAHSTHINVDDGPTLHFAYAYVSLPCTHFHCVIVYISYAKPSMAVKSQPLRPLALNYTGYSVMVFFVSAGRWLVRACVRALSFDPK